MFKLSDVEALCPTARTPALMDLWLKVANSVERINGGRARAIAVADHAVARRLKWIHRVQKVGMVRSINERQRRAFARMSKFSNSPR